MEMCIRDRETDLLEFHNMLIFPRFLFPFCLFKTVFAVIHDAADRRRGRRRDLDQIEFLLIGQPLGFTRGHHAELFALGADQANLIVPDLFVDLQFLTCDG